MIVRRCPSPSGYIYYLYKNSVIVTGIFNPSSHILWIFNPISCSVIIFRIVNPKNTYSWDCKSQRQAPPFCLLIKDISSLTGHDAIVRQQGCSLAMSEPRLNQMKTIDQIVEICFYLINQLNPGSDFFGIV
jgi:hypothetical protein